MNVSVIIPVFNPEKKLMDKILRSINNQNFKGKKEIIIVNEGLGLADSMNKGIIKSKNEIIVTLHQDCIPVGKKWLHDLVEPLKKKEFAASVSDVELPRNLWNDFDFVAKILSCKEQKVITPGLDEKGCAYKKDILIKLGLFNGEDFRTAGEDFDLYIKLKQSHKIAYPHTKVLHFHHYAWNNRIKKEYQLANAFGALVRIYKKNMPMWYLGAIKSIPFLGFLFFFKGLDYKKLKKLILISPVIMLFINFTYSIGFWKGFLRGRQTV